MLESVQCSKNVYKNVEESVPWSRREVRRKKSPETQHRQVAGIAEGDHNSLVRKKDFFQ